MEDSPFALDHTEQDNAWGPDIPDADDDTTDWGTTWDLPSDEDPTPAPAPAQPVPVRPTPAPTAARQGIPGAPRTPNTQPSPAAGTGVAGPSLVPGVPMLTPQQPASPAPAPSAPLGVARAGAPMRIAPVPAPPASPSASPSAVPGVRVPVTPSPAGASQVSGALTPSGVRAPGGPGGVPGVPVPPAAPTRPSPAPTAGVPSATGPGLPSPLAPVSLTPGQVAPTTGPSVPAPLTAGFDDDAEEGEYLEDGDDGWGPGFPDASDEEPEEGDPWAEMSTGWGEEEEGDVVTPQAAGTSSGLTLVEEIEDAVVPGAEATTVAAGAPVALVAADGMELMAHEPDPEPGVPVKRKPGRPPGSKNKIKNTGKTRRMTSRGSHMIGGLRLTPDDFQILGFLSRYRSATVGQLSRRFDRSETALRNRLPRLERAGLVSWAWAMQGKPKLWLITEAGLQTVGMHLTVPKVTLAQLRHTLGLVDLGIQFEKAGEVVLTEREIRAAATRCAPTQRMKAAVDISGIPRTLSPVGDVELDTAAMSNLVRNSLTVPAPGYAFGHIPDMVLVRQRFPSGASGNIAVELELTAKSYSQWRTIITAFRDSNAFAEVFYFVPSKTLGRALLAVIKETNAAHKVKVVRFNAVDKTADPLVTGGH